MHAPKARTLRSVRRVFWHAHVAPKTIKIICRLRAANSARLFQRSIFVAAHGGRIGLGSDAGAWHVMHGQAISDELGYLTAALGPRTEPLLLEAEAYASVTFCRK